MPKIKFLGFQTKPGWRGELPIFETTCPDHGPYQAHPRGRGYLRCPVENCFWEVPAPFTERGKYREPVLNTIRKLYKNIKNTLHSGILLV